MDKIGTLKTLRRYPVKSMMGEDLANAFTGFAGLAGDRVYALVDPAKSGNFPWLSARQVPEMIRFVPRFLDPPPVTEQFPDRSRYKVEVLTPEGDRYDLEDPAFHALLEKRWNRPFHLRFSERGMQDARPISLFGLPSLRLLEQETGMKIDHRRFRANFYVEWENGLAKYEEQLLGRTLQIGEKLKVMIDKKDSRCVIINLEPADATSTPELLKHVGKVHGGCIGVYAVTVVEGVAAAGDPVFLV